MSETIPNALRNSPLFSHLSDDLLNQLAENATLLEFSAGAKLIEEGKKVERLLLIVTGNIKVFTNVFGKVVDLKSMGPGDYVGEVSLLSGKTATATVQAESDISVVALTKATLVQVMEGDETLRKSLEHTTLARAKDTLGKVLQ